MPTWTWVLVSLAVGLAISVPVVAWLEADDPTPPTLRPGRRRREVRR